MSINFKAKAEELDRNKQEAAKNGASFETVREYKNQKSAKNQEPDACIDFSKITLSEKALDDLAIEPRKALLGDWFCESDLGFICAKRGAGKTWLSLHMARALADGTACGPYHAAEPVRVLYIDGEMPLDEIRARNQSLREGSGDNLHFLSHQTFFDKTGKCFCLSETTMQKAVTDLCVAEGFRVVFLDNLTTLFGRVRENVADDWRDFVEGWLLELRRRRIAVVVVAHAGRNGEMRGTSKREDTAFWQIVLDPVEKCATEGAQFVSRFTKNRNPKADPPPLNWHFKPDGAKVMPTWREADPLQILRGWIEDGLDSCSEIAEEMGVTKGAVSKLAKRAEKAGWLRINHRRYTIAEGGGV